ncbi:Transposon TX1 uncharacterized 149 kDa protein [Vitis vinifera]|uniref:Transposon TX1 uncharacterized 149 kDa protein n=1 Tax=Vitis vinifera TaxID=29760 RepID=A0A438JVA9_VITVI|nr:Transposon TX1 uncharacterized 149 kDa protein [Vitis vinifera]
MGTRRLKDKMLHLERWSEEVGCLPSKRSPVQLWWEVLPWISAVVPMKNMKWNEGEKVREEWDVGSRAGSSSGRGKKSWRAAETDGAGAVKKIRGEEQSDDDRIEASADGFAGYGKEAGGVGLSEQDSYRMDWAVKQKEMNWPRVCWERGQSNRGVERAACDGPSSFQRDVLGCVDNKDVERASSDSPSFSQRDGLGRVDNRPKSAGKEGQPSLIVSWASMPLKTILDDSVERASSDDPSSFQRDGLGRLDNRPTSAGREGQPTLAMSWAPLPLKTPLDEPVIKAMASIHHLHAEGWFAEENLVSGMVSTAVRGASESCSIADACLLEEVSRVVGALIEMEESCGPKAFLKEIEGELNGGRKGLRKRKRMWSRGGGLSVSPGNKNSGDDYGIVRSLGVGRCLEWGLNSRGATGGVFVVFWDNRVLQMVEMEVGGERRFLSKLGAIRGLWNELWCVVGDFNMIRFRSERSRGGRLSPTMRRFSEVIEEELRDLPLQGGMFTWSGGFNNPLKSRIDRGMRKGPTPFRFENMWLKEEGFKEITVKKQNAWNLMDFWDKEESVRALSLEEEEARKEAREMYKKWVLLEEVSWRQKSKEIWLKEGDRNTKFFHQMANVHKRKNQMNRVKVNESIDGLNFERLEEGDVEGLEKPFSKEEVFGALSGFCGEKAPGPDEKGEGGEGKAEDLKDFRPISLVGGLYKWLAKELANRMKAVLAKVISTSQNAFVEGWQIMDAMLVANEAIDSIVKSNRGAILCKLDIEKAYDYVDWSFLFAVLENMGFAERRCCWIKWCLSTVRFSIMVNGSPTGFFQSSRGLRQGDPLSPYLFVVLMEAFSCLLKRAVAGGFLSPCLVRGRRGLRANLEKSELIPVGRVENVEELADEFGYKVGKLPSTYLGMPLGAPFKCVAAWDGIEERFRKKLAMVVRIRLEQIQRDFLWGGGALEQKSHLTLWNQVIRGKYGEKRGEWRSCETREAYGVRLWKAISKMGHLVTPSFGFVVGDVSYKETWVNEVWTTEGERGGSWNPCFNRPFNDWELEEVERLFCCLEGKKVRVDEEDRVRWMESKDEVFSPKLSFFVWEASWGRVLTLDPLQKRGFFASRLLEIFDYLEFKMFVKSKKQDRVSKSSTESKYRAMSLACSKIIWLRGLLAELDFSETDPTPLHADNTSAIQITANPVYHERTKHIEISERKYIKGQKATKHIGSIHSSLSKNT